MKKHPYIVGLTGGIGSGKSTVAAEFRHLGIHTVDADYASRAVVEPNMPALAEIAMHFGKDIILPSGQLDRVKLREIIFADGSKNLASSSITSVDQQVDHCAVGVRGQSLCDIRITATL